MKKIITLFLLLSSSVSFAQLTRVGPADIVSGAIAARHINPSTAEIIKIRTRLGLNSAPNAVLTTSTYANPTWLTSLASSKLSWDLSGLTNSTSVGSGAVVTLPNTIQLGNTSVTSVKTSGLIQSSLGLRIPDPDGFGFTVGPGSIVLERFDTSPSISVIFGDPGRSSILDSGSLSFTSSYNPTSIVGSEGGVIILADGGFTPPVHSLDPSIGVGPGAIYFNDVSNTWRAFNGTTWGTLTFTANN